MATFFSLLGHRNHPVEAIFAATDVAEANRVRERSAATKIQSAVRMRQCRRRFLYVRTCIVSIQRLFRGFADRKAALNRRLDDVKRRHVATLHALASIIQAAFRGFFSRKWRCDFYAQKRYLIGVVEESERVRRLAEATREQQTAELQISEHQRQLEAYLRAASGKHHLLSTAVQPGVFRPTAARQGVASVFGSSVEEDLRQLPALNYPRRVFKADVLPAAAPVAVASTDGGGASQVHVDPKGSQAAAGTSVLAATVAQGGSYRKDVLPTNRLSLAAAASYSASSDAKKLEKAIDEKMTKRLHGDSHFAARKPDAPPPIATLRAESEYVDPSRQRHGRR